MSVNFGKLIKTVGAGFEGYGADKKQILAEAMQARAADRQARLDAIDAALKQKTLRTPVLGDQAYLDAKRDEAGIGTKAAVEQARLLSPIKVDEAVASARALAPVKMDEAKTAATIEEGSHRANRTFDNANPAPVQPGFTPVVTTTPSGDQHVSKFNTKTGGVQDTGVGAKANPGSSIPAGIRAKVAENTSTLSTIDEALKSLGEHPDAVGLTKNLPMVGKYLDQRMDPEGVATRALIANVGSLQIHTRTGANMNIREEPRLAPFVPDASDTPAAIRTKLTQLAKFLKIENDALVGGPSATVAAPPSAGVPSFEEWMAKRGGPP